MLENKATISFVIPAFNEEASIRDTIRSIKHMPPDNSYQVVIVDNGSTDRTSEIVQEEGVTLVKQPRNTIASARNSGVAVSEGTVIVFLDADILITRRWQSKIDDVVTHLLKKPLVVTGSRCGVEDEANWLSRYWFARMQYEEANYINSGHMITTRTLFDHIGGFNEKLSTAEDHDFCLRARRVGAEIVNNPELKVIHTGYPKVISGFIAREKWHGAQDFMSLKSILESKVAMFAIFNVLTAAFSIFYAIMKMDLIYILIYLSMMLILSAGATLLKFGFNNIGMLAITSIIFFFYITGRSLALFERLKKLIVF